MGDSYTPLTNVWLILNENNLAPEDWLSQKIYKREFDKITTNNGMVGYKMLRQGSENTWQEIYFFKDNYVLLIENFYISYEMDDRDNFVSSIIIY